MRGDPRSDPNLTEFFVPPQLAQRFGDGDAGTMYYVIWDYDRDNTRTSRAELDVPDAGPRPMPVFGSAGGPPPPEAPKNPPSAVIFVKPT